MPAGRIASRSGFPYHGAMSHRPLRLPVSLGKGLRDLPGLAAALTIGLGLRAYFLSLPLRYDECLTSRLFVDGGIRALFDYAQPNNHVFHTLAVKLSTLVWGSHPLVFRIPAFLAAGASIVLVYLVARAMDKGSGLPSALAAAVFPYLVLFGSIARGYSFLVGLVLALVLVGLGCLRDPGRGRALLFAALSALSLWTMPSALFAVAGLFVWISTVHAVERRPLADLVRRVLAPCALWTLAFTALLYAPVIIVSRGFGPVLRNRYVTPQPFRKLLRNAPAHLEQTFSDFTRDIPAAVIVLGIILVLIGLWASVRKGRWPAALLLPSLAAGSAAMLLLNPRVPFPRTWIFLIPIVLVMADLGLEALLDRLPRAGKALVPAALSVAAAAYAFHLMAVNAVGRYPDVGTFPEAPAIVEFLKPRVNPGDRIRARVPADEVMKFYLRYRGVVYGLPARAKGLGRIQYLVVKPSRYGVPDLTDRPVEKILELGDAEVYRVKRD